MRLNNYTRQSFTRVPVLLRARIFCSRSGSRSFFFFLFNKGFHYLNIFNGNEARNDGAVSARFINSEKCRVLQVVDKNVECTCIYRKCRVIASLVEMSYLMVCLCRDEFYRNSKF